jgi:hypothetical protein
MSLRYLKVATVDCPASDPHANPVAWIAVVESDRGRRICNGDAGENYKKARNISANPTAACGCFIAHFECL